MKYYAIFGMAMAGFAVSAHAQPKHQDTLVHDGREFTLNYQPRVETKLRQTGVGPRDVTRCFWTTRVSVERIAVDPEGKAVAALTRVVGGNLESEGMRIGACAAVSPRETAAFRGNEAKMRQHLASVASADRQHLNTELASLGGGRIAIAR